MSLDLEVLDILIKCDFPPTSYLNFAGITRPELRRLSLDDLESWVRARLPPSSDGVFLVDKFMSNLAGYPSNTQQSQPPVRNPVKVEVKQEPADSSTPSPAPAPTQILDDKGNREQENNHVQPDLREETEEQENNSARLEATDSDSDIEIIEEISNVFIIRVVDAETKAKERILDDVTLDDDEDEATPSTDTPEKSSTTKKRKSNSTVASTSTSPLQVRERPCPASKKIKVNTVNSASTSIPALNPVIKTKDAFPYFLGRRGTTRSVQWTMAEFHGLVSPSQSPHVGELSIVSNCVTKSISSFLSDYYKNKNISLPNLTTLKIRHCHEDWSGAPHSISSHNINYSTQLRLLLQGSPSLHRIEICYKGEIALGTLLRVLGSFPILPSLFALVIRHQDENMVGLEVSDLNGLCQVAAPNMKRLHIGGNILVRGDGKEVKVAFLHLLQRFPNLTKLKIDGCFVAVGHTNGWPKIVLDLPKLTNLRVLELGVDCFQYFLTLETVIKRPKKKNKKTLSTNMDTGVADEPGGLAREYFPVSINFPGTMSSLEIIRFGVLYEFMSLYFSQLPALKVFTVASNWAQSYPNCFPSGKRNIREGPSNISSIEKLKLPDSFQDCFLIRDIMLHFPHLTHIYLNLPSVKFLRAFAKTMITYGPESFQTLEIRIQFDFASSLDSCVLDKIVKPSPAEMEQIKVLKAYPHWRDYVKENQIELPKKNPDLEDPSRFYGLGVLFKKLKLLRILHIPRTLRLPKGPRHWIDDYPPEYSKTLIGFREYPFSVAVGAVCPPTMKLVTWRFDMSEVNNIAFELYRFQNESLIVSDPTSTSTSVKKEVKRD